MLCSYLALRSCGNVNSGSGRPVSVVSPSHRVALCRRADPTRKSDSDVTRVLLMVPFSVLGKSWYLLTSQRRQRSRRCSAPRNEQYRAYQEPADDGDIASGGEPSDDVADGSPDLLDLML